jgi:tripartite-type tricarboxylate transporter receptor subunit TctC
MGIGAIMKLPRRSFLHLAAGAVALPTVSQIAFAQSYPSRPIHLIVGFPAGLAPDVFARLIAQPLSERLGQQVIVQNRPGAGTNIATEVVVKGSPDGYTLLLAGLSNAVNASLYSNLDFNFTRDIAPVAGIDRLPNVIVVNPSVPARTLPEFIAYAKANPGQINYASAGYGTTNNLTAELFKLAVGIDLVHVPYRGSYMPDLLGGQVQALFTPIPTVIEYIRAGKLRALAVTGATRSDSLPEIPAATELVPGFEASTWHGIGAPKDTPAEIIERLSKAINAVLADPKMKERIVSLGGDPMPMTSAAFGTLITEETEKWAKVVKAANIKPE